MQLEAGKELGQVTLELGVELVVGAGVVEQPKNGAVGQRVYGVAKEGHVRVGPVVVLVREQGGLAGVAQPCREVVELLGEFAVGQCALRQLGRCGVWCARQVCLYLDARLPHLRPGQPSIRKRLAQDVGDEKGRGPRVPVGRGIARVEAPLLLGQLLRAPVLMREAEGLDLGRRSGA